MNRITLGQIMRFISISAVVISAVVTVLTSLAGAEPWSPENALRGYLESHYPWEEIQIDNVEVLDEVTGEAPENIIVERGPIGKALFSFVFQSDRKVLVRADIRAFDRVVKCKRSYRKRHVLRENELYIDTMDIRKIPGNAVRNPQKIIGKSLKRSIIANIPISEDMVEQSQIVKRGRMVMLIINQDGLRITAAGQIKEKGYVGSQVRAVNSSSNKEVTGVLIDENTVEVLL